MLLHWAGVPGSKDLQPALSQGSVSLSSDLFASFLEQRDWSHFQYFTPLVTWLLFAGILHVNHLPVKCFTKFKCLSIQHLLPDGTCQSVQKNVFIHSGDCHSYDVHLPCTYFPISFLGMYTETSWWILFPESIFCYFSVEKEWISPFILHTSVLGNDLVLIVIHSLCPQTCKDNCVWNYWMKLSTMITTALTWLLCVPYAYYKSYQVFKHLNKYINVKFFGRTFSIFIKLLNMY